jgi:transcriptional regulator with XRE-family HTH domain
MKDVTEKIKSLRKQRGWTLAEMGSKINLTTSAYNKIELGQTPLTLDRLEEIAKIFEMPLQELIFEERGFVESDKSFIIKDLEKENKLLQDKIKLLEESIKDKSEIIDFLKTNLITNVENDDYELYKAGSLFLGLFEMFNNSYEYYEKVSPFFSQQYEYFENIGLQRSEKYALFPERLAIEFVTVSINKAFLSKNKAFYRMVEEGIIKDEGIKEAFLELKNDDKGVFPPNNLELGEFFLKTKDEILKLNLANYSKFLIKSSEYVEIIRKITLKLYSRLYIENTEGKYKTKNTQVVMLSEAYGDGIQERLDGIVIIEENRQTQNDIILANIQICNFSEFDNVKQTVIKLAKAERIPESFIFEYENKIWYKYLNIQDNFFEENNSLLTLLNQNLDSYLAWNLPALKRINN